MNCMHACLRNCMSSASRFRTLDMCANKGYTHAMVRLGKGGGGISPHIVIAIDEFTNVRGFATPATPPLGKKAV